MNKNTVISKKRELNKRRTKSIKKTNHRKVNKRHSALLNHHGNLRKLATSSKVKKTTPLKLREKITKIKEKNIKSLLKKGTVNKTKRHRTRSKLATHHKSAKNLKKNNENRISKEYNIVNINEARNLEEYNFVNNAKEAKKRA